MSNLVRFEKVDNELNILRIGGKSFLPPDVEWPTNPNGEKMVFIFNIPTNFLNSTLQFNYPKDQVISVFTTYNREDYFLDSIVYNGDIEELQNIKNGYTKVILHSVASPRNDADFLISAREIVIDKEMNEFDGYYEGGLCMVFILHPQIIGIPGRYQMLEELMLYMKEKPDIWFAQGNEIADDFC